MEKQTFATVVTPTARGGEPEITISTIALDRDSDEIVPEGGDFGAYLKNPVVGYGHFRSETIPVGATTSIQVVAGRGVRARWRWLEGDPFADRVRNAFEQGVLRAASIGFLPVESQPNGKGGRRFTKWQALEWSLVPIPANPEAVRTLKGLGLWTEGDVALEIVDEEPTYTFEQIAAAYAGLGHGGARRRHSEPFEPAVFTGDARDLRAAMRVVIREALAESIREAAASAVARMRGRVD